MYTKYLILILFSFSYAFTSKALGQIKAEPLLYKVNYNFTHLYNKQDTSKQFKAEFVLDIGETKSKFCNSIYSSNDPLPDFVLNPPPLSPEVMAKIASTKNEKERTASIEVISRFLVPEILYHMFASNTFVQISTLGRNDFRVETPVTEIHWDIKEETKLFDSIQCQKAVGVYCGRTYTAWFAPSLPFPYGPWKLGGLPGLILEAVDSKNEVRFTIKSTDANTKDKFLYFEELRPLELSEKRYSKLKENFYKDPVAMIRAQLETNIVITEITFKDDEGNILKGHEAKEAIKKEVKVKITNPLEL